jgi:tetratricopeptide (TPR) repeat protein
MLRQFVEKDPKDPFPYYGLAMELKNTGQLEEAARVFADVMTKFPDYTAAYLHAGNTQLELGRRDEAARIYRAGIAACAKKGDHHAKGELEAALAALG